MGPFSNIAMVDEIKLRVSQLISSQGMSDAVRGESDLLEIVSSGVS